MLRSENRDDRLDALDWLCTAPQLLKVSAGELSSSGIAASIVSHLFSDDDDVVKGAVVAVFMIQSTDRSEAFRGTNIASGFFKVARERFGTEVGSVAEHLLLNSWHLDPVSSSAG